ncbi:hypothetical protein V5N11_027404 [Cardamine amara subsp. amara]|uniref:DUF6821 domain-containing protein n=1 Tax=Cardamine amara subsp. amara TaxID=228776 RepID=A0ABD1BT15_CARAN
MEGELQDWEVLQSLRSITEDDNSKSLEEIDDVTQGIIRFDHFSLENSNDLSRVEEVDEDGSVQSGSPGWIEPSSDAPYGPKHFSELWSDSSSDQVEDQRESIAQEKDMEKDWFDSSGEMSLMNSDEIKDESLVSDDLVEGEEKSVGGREEKGFVWWKIPIEILKYCVFKVNPIWSFSMAAAFVGFVMLGRRLYNMKKKSRTLQLKVLLDDKKVANHAARWNEAMSVVKRVPIIRPALPTSVGMNQWSMMTLR